MLDQLVVLPGEQRFLLAAAGEPGVGGPALAPEVRGPGQRAEQAEQQRHAGGDSRARQDRRAGDHADVVDAADPQAHGARTRHRRRDAGDALGYASQLDAAARCDRERPRLRQPHGRREHHVVVDEREVLFLALHVILDQEGLGAREPAGRVVTQQVGERPRHRVLHARRRTGGSQQGPAERRRVARRDESAGVHLRADRGDRLSGVEIDAEGAAVALEEHVRARGERDDAADAHAVRRHGRGPVIERAGRRA